MKKLLTTLLILTVTATFTTLLAQDPPPPPGDHGLPGNQNTGDAPIGGGLFILLSLGAAYGGKRIYELRKERGEINIF